MEPQEERKMETRRRLVAVVELMEDEYPDYTDEQLRYMVENAIGGEGMVVTKSYVERYTVGTEETVELKLTREACVELYDFIREHLDVVNETPFVEQIMMSLEESLDGGDEVVE